jgi:hypothetical protein
MVSAEMLNCKILSTQASHDVMEITNGHWPEMAELKPELCVLERSRMSLPGS